MNNVPTTQINSDGWILFTKASFVTAIGAMLGGIVMFPGDLNIKGFFVMGTLYLIGSTFSLAKTVRDEFEGQKLINKIADARTERILKEYEGESA